MVLSSLASLAIVGIMASTNPVVTARRRDPWDDEPDDAPGGAPSGDGYEYDYDDEDPDAIVDDPEWTEGDFEIITADNVRFRVPSYYLLAHSSVFRDAQSFGTPPPPPEPSAPPAPPAVHIGQETGDGVTGDGVADLADRTKAMVMSPTPQAISQTPPPAHPRGQYLEFTDPDIENAATFRLFLKIAVDGCLDEPPCVMPAYPALAQFLRKYECNGALQILLLYTRELVRGGHHSPYGAFMIGAAIEDEKTCTAALDRPTWTWGDAGPDADENLYVPNECVFNPGALGFADFKRIPPDYLWALSRAWFRIGGSGMAGELSHEFSIALHSLRGCSGHHGGQEARVGGAPFGHAGGPNGGHPNDDQIPYDDDGDYDGDYYQG